MYAEKVSVVYNSDVDYMQPCVWLHLSLYNIGGQVHWTLKNTNRPYFQGVPGSSFTPQFIPWPGKIPYHFKQLRGILISKMASGWSANVPMPAVTICLLEVLLELMRLGYPLKLLRSLIHSIPCWPSATLARGIFRDFLQVISLSLPAMRASVN